MFFYTRFCFIKFSAVLFHDHHAYAAHESGLHFILSIFLRRCMERFMNLFFSLAMSSERIAEELEGTPPQPPHEAALVMPPPSPSVQSNATDEDYRSIPASSVSGSVRSSRSRVSSARETVRHSSPG